MSHRTFRGHTGEVRSVGFSPDGKEILTGSSDDTARLWDAATERELTVLRGNWLGVNSASISRDVKRILTASGDGVARVWEPAGVR